ncbi:hypothetical protein BpHYR1_035369 [Brachionus plicatilis]|uniref:Uncharacterized protein n=1 Tax=Brachionus plicatilis TaxID=10195 RepID=A0A3M7S8J7_BRAPC|nr:hypothetical protein BpHYR1_035369 [Brachionus plicatilis]
MKISIEKSCSVVFSRYKKESDNLNLKIYGNRIVSQKEIKFLGIKFDSNDQKWVAYDLTNKNKFFLPHKGIYNDRMELKDLDLSPNHFNRRILNNINLHFTKSCEIFAKFDLNFRFPDLKVMSKTYTHEDSEKTTPGTIVEDYCRDQALNQKNVISLGLYNTIDLPYFGIFFLHNSSSVFKIFKSGLGLDLRLVKKSNMHIRADIRMSCISNEN